MLRTSNLGCHPGITLVGEKTYGNSTGGPVLVGVRKRFNLELGLGAGANFRQMRDEILQRETGRRRVGDSNV